MGVPRPRSTDRRVRRTRAALQDAMRALLRERGWGELSVQDVCARAGVGRSTFYTHFADLEELAASGLKELGQVIRGAAVASAGRKAPFGFALGLLRHVAEHRVPFRELVGPRGAQQGPVKLFRELVLSLVRQDLAELGSPGPVRDAAAHFLAGGFVELLAPWVVAPDPIPPEQMGQLFLELARPVVARVVTGPSR